MKKLLCIIVSCFSIMAYSQKKQKEIEKIECIKAAGPNLLDTKKEVKYGTPFCIEVSGVNTFLTKSFSTYTPINFDFSTKSFLDIKIEEKTPDGTILPNKKTKKKNPKTKI